MSYYLILDGHKIKLRKSSVLLNIGNYWYSSYCYPTKDGILSSKGKPVIFCSDTLNKILVDEQHKDNIYVKKFNWFTKNEYIKAQYDDTINVNYV